MINKTIGNVEYRLGIQQDAYPNCPRDNNNLGTLVTAHNNYVGDEELPTGASSIDDAFEEHLESKGLTLDDINYHKVWLMDHSGISISTKPFGCQWDSGTWGFIYVNIKDKDIFDNEYDEEKVLDILNNEIISLNTYYQGDILEYSIKSRKIINIDGEKYFTDWETLHSGGGYESLENMSDDIIDLNIFSKKDILNCNMCF